MKGAGHFVAQKRPETFNHLLDEYLRVLTPVKTEAIPV